MNGHIPCLTTGAWRGCSTRCLPAPSAALALEQHLAVLLHHAPITSKLGAELGRPNGPGAALVRAREQLADGAQPPPSLAELAREAGLSRYQFLRAFSARFGLPPAAWAGQQRLARAERQLAWAWPWPTRPRPAALPTKAT